MNADRPKKIPVVELFLSVQGEGALAGQVSFFLRTGGCMYRCDWCDSMHAVDPKEIKKRASRMTQHEIVQALFALRSKTQEAIVMRRASLPWVTLTGGDPVMWDLSEVVARSKLNFRVAVETQGSLWQDWLEQCDMVTCSPKPPSSGMTDKFDVAMLQKYWARLGEKLVLKIVIFTDEDLEFASRVRQIAPRARMFLTSGTPQSEYAVEANRKLDVCIGYRRLAERITADPQFYDVTVLPQLHVLAWGTELGR